MDPYTQSRLSALRDQISALEHQFWSYLQNLDDFHRLTAPLPYHLDDDGAARRYRPEDYPHSRRFNTPPQDPAPATTAPASVHEAVAQHHEQQAAEALRAGNAPAAVAHAAEAQKQRAIAAATEPGAAKPSAAAAQSAIETLKQHPLVSHLTQSIAQNPQLTNPSTQQAVHEALTGIVAAAGGAAPVATKLTAAHPSLSQRLSQLSAGIPKATQWAQTHMSQAQQLLQQAQQTGAQLQGVGKQVAQGVNKVRELSGIVPL